MTFDRETSAGYLVNHLARLLTWQIEQRLNPLGLRIGAFPALLHLWETDGLTQKDLVDRLSIEQPTMAATLARMERDGFIRRAQDENDGRMQRIWLTPKAKALEGPATAAATGLNALALGDLTPQEAAAFLEMMQRIIGRLHRPQS